MKPLFDKLFKLHLKSSNQPLEDYITEIFAFCLQIDAIFRNKFLHLLNLPNKEFSSFYIDTQCAYNAESRRTDLEINLGHSYIIIESKVGSTEGLNQLDAYADILAEKGQDHKLLVFLTANREEKEKAYPNGIIFQQLRWHEVGMCIDNSCNTITLELKNFLKEKKLIMEKLNYNDLVTFQSFFDLRRKFNDILRNDVSKLFTKKGLYSYYINQPTIRHNEFVLAYNYGKEVSISLGFGNGWGEHPCVFTRLWISHKKDKSGKFAKEFHEILTGKNWDLISTNPNGYSLECKKPLIDFLKLENNQRTEIVSFFQNCIDDLMLIVPNTPSVFNLAEKPVATDIAEA